MFVKSDNALQMFGYYTKLTIKSWFQYKVDACIRSFAVFLRESTNIIVIFLTLMTFDNINGWNGNELLFMFSLVFLTYGIMIILFTGVRDFEIMISRGELDRFFLRPRGILFQVISSNSDWFAAIGHGMLGIILFIFSAGRIGIIWNWCNIVYYVLVVVGGVLIQGSIFLFIASLSFYVMKTKNIRAVTYGNVRRFAGYPISIFPQVIQIVMIYIIPFAFVNYFPAQYLLNKSDMANYPDWYLYITPIVGIFMMVISYIFWLNSLKKYKSSGN